MFSALVGFSLTGKYQLLIGEERVELRPLNECVGHVLDQIRLQYPFGVEGRDGVSEDLMEIQWSAKVNSRGMGLSTESKVSMWNHSLRYHS